MESQRFRGRTVLEGERASATEEIAVSGAHAGIVQGERVFWPQVEGIWWEGESVKRERRRWQSRVCRWSG